MRVITVCILILAVAGCAKHQDAQNSDKAINEWKNEIKEKYTGGLPAVDPSTPESNVTIIYYDDHNYEREVSPSVAVAIDGKVLFEAAVDGRVPSRDPASRWLQRFWKISH